MNTRTKRSMVALIVGLTCTACDSMGRRLALSAAEETGDQIQDEANALGFFRPVTVLGQVVDGESGAGIDGALVFAADATGNVVTSAAVTNSTGAYALTVPVRRDAGGNPVSGTFTLRASASGYEAFPAATHPSLPVSIASARLDVGAQRYEITSDRTKLALASLPGERRGLATISGTLGGYAPLGAIVVAECAAPPCAFGYAERNGQYTIFNVPDGEYTVRAYKAGSTVAPVQVTVSFAIDLIAVDLLQDGASTTEDVRAALLVRAE